MSITPSNIDHALPHLLLAQLELEDKLARGESALPDEEVVAPTIADVTSTDPEYVTPQLSYTPVARIPTPAPKDGRTVIAIDDKKLPLEIQCVVSDNKIFSVAIVALDVEISAECISVMLNDAVTVKPPMLSPLTLIVDGRNYSVVYAGGNHTFGTIRNISFVRTQ